MAWQKVMFFFLMDGIIGQLIVMKRAMRAFCWLAAATLLAAGFPVSGEAKSYSSGGHSYSSSSHSSSSGGSHRFSSGGGSMHSSGYGSSSGGGSHSSSA